MPGMTTKEYNTSYLWTGALVGSISAALVYWTVEIKPWAPVGWTISNSKDEAIDNTPISK